MKICAVIAEYNPLHNGHIYHIKKARELTGCDFLVLAMSGSFTQRGEPAICSKWQRASWALQAGFDLVIELPCFYAVSSAESFARGAVKLLDGLGVCESLCFGSETPSADVLIKAAKAQLSPGFPAALKRSLKDGNTYARAVQHATGGSSDADAALSSPNSILAIEYIKSLISLNSGMEPVPVERIPYNENVGSASDIRQIARESMPTGYVPEYVLESLKNERVFIEHFDFAAVSELRRLGASGIANLRGVSEGLHNRIYAAARERGSISGVIAAAKTRRYLYTRLQRIITSALLGITSDMERRIATDGYPVYARLLGFKRAAAPLLKSIKDAASIPILTKAADYNKLLPKECHSLFLLDCLATDLHELAAGREAAGRDFTQRLIIE
ncbi:MAG: nucleotidyltransferase family protein [Christensenellales bacterium]|jgi:predicted nucleotidyltransferase